MDRDQIFLQQPGFWLSNPAGGRGVWVLSPISGAANRWRLDVLKREYAVGAVYHSMTHWSLEQSYAARYVAGTYHDKVRTDGISFPAGSWSTTDTSYPPWRMWLTNSANVKIKITPPAGTTRVFVLGYPAAGADDAAIVTVVGNGVANKATLDFSTGAGNDFGTTVPTLTKFVKIATFASGADGTNDYVTIEPSQAKFCRLIAFVCATNTAADPDAGTSADPTAVFDPEALTQIATGAAHNPIMIRSTARAMAVFCDDRTHADNFTSSFNGQLTGVAEDARTGDGAAIAPTDNDWWGVAADSFVYSVTGSLTFPYRLQTISSLTYDHTGLTLTAAAGTFDNYVSDTRLAGDYVAVTAGTGVTVGIYAVASVAGDGSSITLDGAGLGIGTDPSDVQVKAFYSTISTYRQEYSWTASGCAVRNTIVANAAAVTRGITFDFDSNASGGGWTQKPILTAAFPRGRAGASGAWVTIGPTDGGSYCSASGAVWQLLGAGAGIPLMTDLMVSASMRDATGDLILGGRFGEITYLVAGGPFSKIYCLRAAITDTDYAWVAGDVYEAYQLWRVTAYEQKDQVLNV